MDADGDGTHVDAHGCAYADSHADIHGYSDTNVDLDSDGAHVDAHGYADADSHADGHCYSDTNMDADVDGTHGYADAHADLDSDARRRAALLHAGSLPPRGHPQFGRAARRSGAAG